MKWFWMMVEFGIMKYLDRRDKTYSPQSPKRDPTILIQKLKKALKWSWAHRSCRVPDGCGNLSSGPVLHEVLMVLWELWAPELWEEKNIKFGWEGQEETKVLVGCITEGHGATTLSKNLDTDCLIQKNRRGCFLPYFTNQERLPEPTSFSSWALVFYEGYEKPQTACSSHRSPYSGVFFFFFF